MEIIKLNAWSGILDYNRTHKQLLLRNNQGEVEELDQLENVDVLFTGVFYIEIPPVSSKEINIYEGGENDKRYIEERYFEEVHWYGGATVFVLQIEKRKYYIAADAVKVTRNKLPTWQTSIQAPRKEPF